MAGKEGLAGRLDAGLARLAEVLEAEAERLSTAPAEHAVQADKIGKGLRSLAMGARSIADAGSAVDKLRADPADEDIDDEEADDEEPRLSPEALEELRDDVERRYARFDQEPDGAVPPRTGVVRAGPAAGAAGVGGAGAWPPAASDGRLEHLAVPGRPGRGQDPSGRAVAHRPSG